MTIIDTAKRSRIMKRSIKLGHCICDPKRPCPCDIFKGRGICPCAGERPEPIDVSRIKLTELVHNAGCASKIPAADLEDLLSRLPPVDDPGVISGLAAGDDAAIYKIDDHTTLVQTVDVFTPCVDDPYMFGKICACNCLSDIYAMGGVPRTALSVLAFPSETCDKEIMYLMLKGAMEVLQIAQCALIGGHSIKDEEIKLGFAITGTIDAGKAVALETARVGDVLVLTKPLGVGVLNFANQIGRANKNGLVAAERSMMVLNKDASEAMIKVGVSACTDITGFGLYGHLTRMMRHSATAARIYADALPIFEGVLELLHEGIIPGANERNAEFVGADLVVADDVAEEYMYLGFSSETSGGLLIAVPEIRHKLLTDELTSRGVDWAIVGEIIPGENGGIELIASSLKGERMELRKEKDAPVRSSEKGTCCCAAADVHEYGMNETGLLSTGPASMRAFGELIAAVSASGKIDMRTKELILFALVVLQRCEDCLDMHYEKALGMGITREELDEAAWCAIAIGGAPVKMVYNVFLDKRKGK
ncbi:MAG: selenide, water dikinase SelD [Syntrophus sp. (in: bacteria)]